MRLGEVVRIIVLFLTLAKSAISVNVVKITNESGFGVFVDNVNSGTDYSGTTVFLDSDLSFSGNTLEPIGNGTINYFRGVFDGQGYIINNLIMNVSTAVYTGLFGYSNGLTIRNVVLDDSCSIVNRYEISTGQVIYMGGYIGQCQSINRHCIIEDVVNMARVSFGGSINGNTLLLGGIIGVGWALDSYNLVVRSCVNYGDVIHEGLIEGYCNIGGIVGHFINDIKYIQNCINYGTIRHNGTTAGVKYIGGIAGYSSSSENGEATIENCLSAGEVRSNNETICFKGSIVGYIECSTNITHCFWSNATGCDIAYGTDGKSVTITNSSRAELDADLLRDMIEYARQNTIPTSTSLSEYHVLHLNGGKINNIAQETLLVKQSRFPTPMKEGTAFLFWCGDISCNVTYNSSDSSASGMVDLYAIWNTSTVTFDFGNGTVVDAVFSYNTKIIYPDDEREGYTLSWANYHELMPGTDVTLYTQWSPNNYIVTFNVSGGDPLSNNEATKRVTFAEKYGDLPEPTKEGYMFIGWFDGGGGDATEVTNKTTVTTPYNHTLYAHWEEITNQVEVVFNTKDLTEEEVEKIIKQYTKAGFKITKFEKSSESGEISVIIKFADKDDAKEFVGEINKLGGGDVIKEVKFVFGDGSFSATVYPLSFLSILFL